MWVLRCRECGLIVSSGVVDSTLRAFETVALQLLRPHHGRTARIASWLSDAARYGRLWMVLSVLAAIRPGTRRSGRDGMLAWLGATGASFALKRVVSRKRPWTMGRAGARTRSSSMPSSHTAAAVGYATAATLAVPLTGVVLLPLAATVAWSRAATGRHFPTDVAVGAAIGLAAGTLVHASTSASSARRSGDDAENHDRAVRAMPTCQAPTTALKGSSAD
jgi:membrane-associated phospholipid phosphatase